MKIIFAALLSLLLFMSCQSGNSEESTTQSEKHNSEESTTEVQDTVEVDTIPLTPYQLKKQAWEKENSTKLPDEINLELLNREIGSCELESILRVYKNCFITVFTEGSDARRYYFVTFSLDGKFLDLVYYGTESFGVNFTTEFIRENFIKVINFNEEGFEIDSYGDDSFDHLGMEGSYIYVKDDGIFQTIKTRNSKILASEIDSKIFDYYTQKINELYPNLKIMMTPFDNIPGNNSATDEDVYESLEGGGLYSSCLEVRNSNYDLIGVIGYRNEGNTDSIPLTFSYVLSEDQKPIIHYGIISAGGHLYLEVVKLLSKTKNNPIQVSKDYYGYGYEEFQDSLVLKAPIHTVKGNFKKLFGNPLEEGDVEKLRGLNKHE